MLDKTNAEKLATKHFETFNPRAAMEKAASSMPAEARPRVLDYYHSKFLPRINAIAAKNIALVINEDEAARMLEVLTDEDQAQLNSIFQLTMFEGSIVIYNEAWRMMRHAAEDDPTEEELAYLDSYARERGYGKLLDAPPPIAIGKTNDRDDIVFNNIMLTTYLQAMWDLVLDSIRAVLEHPVASQVSEDLLEKMIQKRMSSALEKLSVMATRQFGKMLGVPEDEIERGVAAIRAARD